MIITDYSTAAQIARAYYNSSDADNFYAIVWGGEDIHIGLYEKESDSIFEASRRTVRKLFSLLKLNESSRVLDIGAGYGGTARYLVRTIGCHVDCLNLSEIQNQRNYQLNRAQGVMDKIRIIEGSFENIPVEDQRYDVVCSQDAILHSGNRRKVLEEVARVLNAKGEFIFTDPMQHVNCPPEVLRPVLDRIHLDSLATIHFYTENLEKLGFDKVQIIELSEQLVTHYDRVLREVEGRYDEILKQCSQEYIDRMKIGLKYWIEAGQRGYLSWGILHFRKK